MKRLWLLFVMLFLAACGGGGTSSTSGGAQPTSSTGTGAVSLKFVDAANKTTAKVASSIPTANAGRVRVLFSSATFDTIVDLPFSPTPTPVTLPPETYTAEALYYENGTVRRLTSYGITNSIVVTPGTNTVQSISMTELDRSLTVTALEATGKTTVYSGKQYNVTAAPALSTLGLADAWSLAVSTDPFSGLADIYPSPTTAHLNMTAPLTQTAGFLYFQSKFFMRSDFLQDGESASDWVFIKEPTPLELLVSNLGGLVPNGSDLVAPQITSFSVPWKVGTKTISPISITATDNAGIAAYMITEDATNPPTKDTLGWLAKAPTNYPWSGTLLPGQDKEVTLYAWVMDYSGNVSLPSDITQRKVTINDSPVLTKFTVPNTTLFNENVPKITFNAIRYTGDVKTLKYKITETPLPPAKSDFTEQVPTPDINNDFVVPYTVTSVDPQPGVKYTVPLFLWVMDANTISQPLNNSVTICDLPQVTSFRVWSPVPNGKTVTVLELKGAASDGNPVKYLVTTTSTPPNANDITRDTPQPSIDVPSATAGASIPIYAWVKDSQERVSLPKVIYVRFTAP